MSAFLLMTTLLFDMHDTQHLFNLSNIVNKHDNAKDCILHSKHVI